MRRHRTSIHEGITECDDPICACEPEPRWQAVREEMEQAQQQARPIAVIFDVDGTLVDSNHAHASAFAEAMREAGFEEPVERIRTFIGMRSDRLLPAAINIEKDSEIGERIVSRKKAIFSEKYLPSLKPCPGARELVMELRRRGIEIIAASSADEHELGDLLAAANVRDLLTRHTPSKEVSTSKPSPEIVRAALDELNVEPAKAIMIGDTPYDVESATAAGVVIIALRTGGWNDDDLTGAAAIYNDPADLLRHLERHF